MIKAKQNKIISFGDNYRKEKKGGNTLINESCLLRRDMNWDEFANTIDEEFKHQDKVPIICGACSDGSEPYTISIKLQQNLREKAKKFLPIDAFDLGDKIIKRAKSGKINVHIPEVFEANGFEKHFDKISSKISTFLFGPSFLAKPELQNTINFSVGNVFDRAKKPQEKPCVFMFRNGWYQIAKKDNSGVKELASSLFQNLKKDSLVVLGHYDIKQRPRYNLEDIHKVPETLKEIGFEALNKATCKYPELEKIPLIYKKIK